MQLEKFRFGCTYKKLRHKGTENQILDHVLFSRKSSFFFFFLDTN